MFLLLAAPHPNAFATHLLFGLLPRPRVRLQPAPPLPNEPGALPHPVAQLRGQEELPQHQLRRNVFKVHLL